MASNRRATELLRGRAGIAPGAGIELHIGAGQRGPFVILAAKQARENGRQRHDDGAGDLSDTGDQGNAGPDHGADAADGLRRVLGGGELIDAHAGAGRGTEGAKRRDAGSRYSRCGRSANRRHACHRGRRHARIGASKWRIEPLSEAAETAGDAAAEPAKAWHGKAAAAAARGSVAETGSRGRAHQANGRQAADHAAQHRPDDREGGELRHHTADDALTDFADLLEAESALLQHRVKHVGGRALDRLQRRLQRLGPQFVGLPEFLALRFQALVLRDGFATPRDHVPFLRVVGVEAFGFDLLPQPDQRDLTSAVFHRRVDQAVLGFEDHVLLFQRLGFEVERREVFQLLRGRDLLFDLGGKPGHAFLVGIGGLAVGVLRFLERLKMRFQVGHRAAALHRGIGAGLGRLNLARGVAAKLADPVFDVLPSALDPRQAGTGGVRRVLADALGLLHREPLIEGHPAPLVQLGLVVGTAGRELVCSRIAGAADALTIITHARAAAVEPPELHHAAGRPELTGKPGRLLGELGIEVVDAALGGRDGGIHAIGEEPA